MGVLKWASQWCPHLVNVQVEPCYISPPSFMNALLTPRSANSFADFTLKLCRHHTSGMPEFFFFLWSYFFSYSSPKILDPVRYKKFQFCSVFPLDFNPKRSCWEENEKITLKSAYGFSKGTLKLGPSQYNQGTELQRVSEDGKVEALRSIQWNI